MNKTPYFLITMLISLLLMSIGQVQAHDRLPYHAPLVDASAQFQDQDFIEKAVDRSIAAVGDTLTYTVTFRNPKSIPLTQVVITDYYDARLDNIRVLSSSVGTTTINGNIITVQDVELVPGQSFSLVIEARISDRASAGDLLQSAATLESPNASIHVSNTVETAILPGALPATGEISRGARFIWQMMPLILLISVGGFLMVSMRTYKRLRDQAGTD